MNKRNLLLLPIFFLTACHFNKKVEGNNNLKTQQISETGFTAVEVSGPFQVTIQQGNDYAVTVEADENLLEYIDIKKDGRELEISEKDNYNLQSKRGIHITVQMPDIEELSVTGSGLIKSAATLNSKDRIELHITGSGNIQTELDAPKVSSEITGSGTATLSGKTRDLAVHITGSGDCLSEALKSENCDIEITGSGTAKVYASAALDVSIGGSGDVFYAGQPKITQSIGGSGKIRPL